tara:strand:+ start:3822 stop:4130 length:309 start_codon:yes stop_codon:yes gene_type:complete
MLTFRHGAREIALDIDKYQGCLMRVEHNEAPWLLLLITGDSCDQTTLAVVRFSYDGPAAAGWSNFSQARNQHSIELAQPYMGFEIARTTPYQDRFSGEDKAW